MTHPKNGMERLEALLDVFEETILSASDEEIIEETRLEGRDPEAVANEVRVLINSQIEKYRQRSQGETPLLGKPLAGTKKSRLPIISWHWQIPVTLAAGILVGIALTPLWRAEQDRVQPPISTEQIRGEMKGGQPTGECELTVDKTALPPAEEWLKLIAEDVVQGRVDEAVGQLEVFRCYYPDYKKSPSSASPQKPEMQ
jgi:hypothetical protein